jgi:hypothetical protein
MSKLSLKEDAEKICQDYLDCGLDNIKWQQDKYKKFINILFELKKWQLWQIAEALNTRIDIIERYINKQTKPKPISEEMQNRINKFLKIEHLNK